MTLDSDQQQALDSCAAKKVIIAGPGSGKTRLLVEMIAKECVTHCAQGIAILTYSNAAADEIKRRVVEPVPTASRLGYCGTLHSFLFMLLRQFSGMSGLGSNIAVIEPDTASLMLAKIAAEMRARTPLSRLEKLVSDPAFVNDQIGVSDIHRAAPLDLLVATEFLHRLSESGLLTFDTLLAHGVRLVRKISEMGDWPYPAIFWDEAQDGADQDFRILDDAGAERKTVCGDQDQSIYGFRGAEPSKLVALTKRPDWSAFVLEKNYRCSSGICHAANLTIRNNQNRISKNSVPVTNDFGLVKVFTYNNPIDERRGILCEVLNGISSGVKLSEIAVLARTRAIAIEIVEYLQVNGVKVKIPDNESTLPKDWLLCKLLLTAAAAPWSDFATLAYIEKKEGSKIADRLARECEIKMVRLSDCYFGEGWIACYPPPLIYLDKEIIWTFLASYGVSRDSIERVVEIAASLEGRLDTRTLAAALSNRKEEKPQDGVSVLTVHSAKGTEFERVIIAGVEEGIFPHNMSRTSDEIEEERRLFFVALTRAKHRVVITLCSERPQSRGPNVKPGPPIKREPSRFIKEAGL